MSAHWRAPGLSGAYLSPTQLSEYVAFVAHQVRAGGYLVEYDEARRWHQRLYRDQRVDLWLISWLPSQGTQLHDHGGSAGAFTVLTGELAEAIHQPGAGRLGAGPPGLTERRRPSGSGVGFGRRYVHDVRNLSTEPAVSVHAYSPPLTSMRFYDLDGAGRLRTLMSMPTEDPEPALDPAEFGSPAA